MNWSWTEAAAGRDGSLSLPAGWTQSRVGHVSRIINGMPYDSKYFGTDGEPLIRIRDLSTTDVETRYNGPQLTEYRVSRNTLLVGMDGEFNTGRWRLSEPALLNQRVLAIESGPYWSKWLEYCLPFALNVLNDLAYSTTVKHLSSFEVARVRIPTPPEGEMKKIANYLDRETAEIDAFITDQSRFIDLIEERTSVLIETTITGKQLGTTPRKESGSAWIGDIPNHWEMERISWLFSNVGSGTTPASDDVDSFNGTIPWVTSSELRETGVSITKKLVSDEAVKKYSALRVHPAGSLMIAMYGATIGRLGWLEVPATVNQAICVFSDYRKGPSKYPFFALLAARRHLLTLASGGGQPNINQDKLRSLRIPIPPEHEQTDIVRSLDKSLRDATQLAREAKILIDLARERRAALITAAVTGQIDVTAKNKPAAEQIEDDIAQGLHREYA